MFERYTHINFSTFFERLQRERWKNVPYFYKFDFNFQGFLNVILFFQKNILFLIIFSMIKIWLLLFIFISSCLSIYISILFCMLYSLISLKDIILIKLFLRLSSHASLCQDPLNLSIIKHS